MLACLPYPDQTNETDPLQAQIGILLVSRLHLRLWSQPTSTLLFRDITSPPPPRNTAAEIDP